MGKIIRNGIKYSGTTNSADKINYNNTLSGLEAETAQEAFDELNTKIKNGGSNIKYLTKAEYEALPESKLTDDVEYRITDANTAAKIDATDVIYGEGTVADAISEVNTAIDEVSGIVNEVKNDVNTLSDSLGVISGNDGDVYWYKTGQVVTVIMDNAQRTIEAGYFATIPYKPIMNMVVTGYGGQAYTFSNSHGKLYTDKIDNKWCALTFTYITND